MSDSPHEASADPALAISSLVKQYSGRRVVDGLDLVAPASSVTAILGPNGAGKTTTVEICEGLRTPDAGTVQVLGRAPHDPSLRCRVGVMLQDGGVYGSITAREALTHAAALFGAPHSAVDLIEALGLGEVASVASRRLSGGQRQRLGVALAIVGRPELIFLDEPTAGLDPQSRRAVWDLIAALRAAGVSVVITTHYLEGAEQLADHVVIVDRGKAIASGSPSELVSNPTSALRFTASPGLDLQPLRHLLSESGTATEVSPGTYVVTAVNLSEAMGRVSVWCADVGVTPASLTSEQRTLEDVFLELTGEELRP